MNNKIKFRGFTLVEILIVIVIISILTSLAAVSYRQYIVKSRRTAVQEELMQIQQSMEEYYAINHTYKSSSGACAPIANWGNTANSGFYQLECDVINGYVITAQAIGTQASDDAECKHMFLFRNGQRGGGSTSDKSSSNKGNCW